MFAICSSLSYHHQVRILPKPDASLPTVNWLFLDLNSYFASVEQQERPELRGRPVGVIPIETENTCCIAASYEAKGYGVKTGTNVADARLLCPHIVLVEARPKLYVEYHHKIVDAVGHCLPVTTVMSVDEMACRLMGRERALPNATTLGLDIKQSLRGVGETLRCSIGLAPNRYLAKLASDMLKPDGMTVLLKRDLPQSLYRLELRDLIGVSRAMERRINGHGITTVEQLCQLSPERMRKVWGSIVGERMWHWLRGADFEAPETKRKSLGKQHILAPELRSREKAFLVAQKMLQHVAARLRKLELWAGGLGAFVEFMNARNAPPVEAWKAEMRISQCHDTFTLQQHLHKLWEGCPSAKPIQVGVWLFELTPDNLHTLSLFDDTERQCRLSTVVDALNDRYGQGAVYFANISEVRQAAPTRIPFSSVPDLKAF
jgi:DNA polymerase-4